MSNVGVLSSVIESFGIIFVSEIADRTFILVLIYASKISWFPLLITGLLAMGLMNILAIGVGYLVPLILVKGLVDWIGFACFFIFGIFSIYDYFTKDSKNLHEIMLDEQEEQANAYKSYTDTELIGQSPNQNQNTFANCCELFGLLCASELGDKSEITTIAIAAIYNLYGVLIGTMLAYFSTIVLAVLLGHILCKYLSEKSMSLIGGIIFLLFALQILLYKVGILVEENNMVQ